MPRANRIGNGVVLAGNEHAAAIEDAYPVSRGHVVNAGEAAGQTIPHAHVHVIPRYPDNVEDPRGGVRPVIPERAGGRARARIAAPLALNRRC